MSAKTTVTREELEKFIEEEYISYCEYRDKNPDNIEGLLVFEQSYPQFRTRYEQEQCQIGPSS